MIYPAWLHVIKQPSIFSVQLKVKRPPCGHTTLPTEILGMYELFGLGQYFTINLNASNNDYLNSV